MIQQGQVAGGFKCNTAEALELYTDWSLWMTYNNPAVVTLGLRSQHDWTKPLSSKSRMTFVCSTSLSLINRPTSFIDWQALLVSILLCFWSNIQFNHQLSTVAHTNAHSHPLTLCAITKSPFSFRSAGEQKKTEHLDIWFRGRNNNKNA